MIGSLIPYRLEVMLKRSWTCCLEKCGSTNLELLSCILICLTRKTRDSVHHWSWGINGSIIIWLFAALKICATQVQEVLEFNFARQHIGQTFIYVLIEYSQHVQRFCVFLITSKDQFTDYWIPLTPHAGIEMARVYIFERTQQRCWSISRRLPFQLHSLDNIRHTNRVLCYEFYM